jgi:hypothetical protein
MKKGKNNSKRIQINISKRWIYTLITLGILLVIGVIVYANDLSTTIPSPGHAISDIQTCDTPGDILEINSTGSWSCVSASSLGISWAQAINGTLELSSSLANVVTTPSGCSSNQFLEYTGSSWTCKSPLK